MGNSMLGNPVNSCQVCYVIRINILISLTLIDARFVARTVISNCLPTDTLFRILLCALLFTTLLPVISPNLTFIVCGCLNACDRIHRYLI